MSSSESMFVLYMMVNLRSLCAKTTAVEAVLEFKMEFCLIFPCCMFFFWPEIGEYHVARMVPGDVLRLEWINKNKVADDIAKF